MSKTTKLITYLRDNCANYDRHYGGCFSGDCKIEKGKRCWYFEKCVLPKPDYPYKTPGYNYEKLYDEYGKINLAYLNKKVKSRVCDICGEIILPRYKYCEKCGKKQKRENARERIRKHRSAMSQCNA